MRSAVGRAKGGRKTGGGIFGLSYWFVFLALLLVFLALKSKAFNFALSDENNLFYMGKLIAEGKVPYRDFFFSHTPLGILVNAVIFKLFGFNFILLKAVAVVSVAATSVIVFRMVRDSYDGRTAVLSAALFMFSYSVLRASSHPMGQDLTTLFMVLSLYMFSKRRHLESGILVGVASFAGIYALVLVGAYGLFFIWRRPKLKEVVFPVLGGFLAVFAAYNAFFYLWAGAPYLDGVFLYHLRKMVFQQHNLRTLAFALWTNMLLFVPLLGALALYKRPKFFDEFTCVVACATAGFLAFLVGVNTVFEHYFLLIAPFAAILSSRVILHFLDGVKGKWAVRAFLAFAILYSVWAIAGYLYHEANFFETPPAMAAYIASKTGPQAEVFGDSMSAPLVALLADRRIALDEADTNVQRFASNTTDINEFVGRLKGANLKMVIASPPPQGVTNMNDFRQFLIGSCRPLKDFDEPDVGKYVLYYCG